MTEISLNDALHALGYTTRPARAMHKKDILKGGVVVFTGAAGEVWAWLRERHA